MRTPQLEAHVRIDIIDAARDNAAFRRVVDTGEHEQVVVMTIPVSGDVGEEVHPETDQVLIFVEGKAEAQLDGVSRSVDDGDLVFVRAGVRHNFINRGESPLRLITIYAPPHHAPGTIHETRAEAEAAEAEH